MFPAKKLLFVNRSFQVRLLTFLRHQLNDFATGFAVLLAFFRPMAESTGQFTAEKSSADDGHIGSAIDHFLQGEKIVDLKQRREMREYSIID